MMIEGGSYKTNGWVRMLGKNRENKATKKPEARNFKEFSQRWWVYEGEQKNVVG